MAFIESMAIEVSRATTPDRPIASDPFPRFTYDEAIERFGSDKPDVRFGMELVDIAPALLGEDGQPASGFRVFDEALAAGGRVKAIVAPGQATITRREIDGLTELAKRFGAKGLAHLALEDGEVRGPIAKFLSDDVQRAIIERTAADEGDLILIVADTPAVTAEVLGRLRVELGDRLQLADPTVLAYAWVHRFPMYQWDAENGRWDATHNPFSGVLPEDEELLVTASGDPARPSPDDPAGRARAMQYDLVLNGWELGGGSVRIHRRDLLERSFLLQGQTIDGMREKFGAILDAFEYGAPPHGGIALGIDRWAALFASQTNIREVMAFPKTQSGSDPMLEAPSPPDPEQYEELGPAVRRAAREGAAGVTGRDQALTTAPGLGIPPLDAIAARPRLAALAGALCIAFSGIFYSWAEVSPSTGTVFRALFGLPLLVLVAMAEQRRYGPLPMRSVRLAAIAGVFFAGDLMFWHHAIEYVGAGLATVLGNLQVLIVGVVAWLVFGERPSRAILLAVPIVLAGVVLISGRRRCGRLRRRSGPRGRPGRRDRAVLCRLPADHPPRRARSPPAGRPGGGRHAEHGDRRRGGRARRRRPRPDTDARQPRLARPPGPDLAVTRLPVHLDVPATPSRCRHLDHPARAAGGHDRPGRRPAQRASVDRPARGRRPGRRWDRGRDGAGRPCPRRTPCGERRAPQRGRLGSPG